MSRLKALIVTVNLVSISIVGSGSGVPVLATTASLEPISGHQAGSYPQIRTPKVWQFAQALPTLRLGSVGDAVSELQAMLTLLGYYTGPIDGFYRESTQSAVVQFQTAADILADGVVGASTWRKLFPNPDEVPTADLPTVPANPGATATATAPPTTPNSPRSAVATAAPPNPAPTAEPRPTPPAAAPPRPAPSQPVAVALPVLKKGMYGPAIVQLQERLKALGFYSGAIDGVFGSQTEAAVMRIQRTHNLTADGVVGPITWGIIFRAES